MDLGEDLLVFGSKEHLQAVAQYEENILERRYVGGLCTWMNSRLAYGYDPIDKIYILQDNDITHVLNLFEDKVPINVKKYFPKSRAIKMSDNKKMPKNLAVSAMNWIGKSVHSAPDTKLFIHCAGGMNRSATIVWFYLASIGVDKEKARGFIKRTNPYANPGRRDMVPPGYDLPEQMIQYGKDNWKTLRKSLFEFYK